MRLSYFVAQLQIGDEDEDGESIRCDMESFPNIRRPRMPVNILSQLNRWRGFQVSYVDSLRSLRPIWAIWQGNLHTICTRCEKGSEPEVQVSWPPLWPIPKIWNFVPCGRVGRWDKKYSHFKSVWIGVRGIVTVPLTTWLIQFATPLCYTATQTWYPSHPGCPFPSPNLKSEWVTWKRWRNERARVLRLIVPLSLPVSLPPFPSVNQPFHSW